MEPEEAPCGKREVVLLEIDAHNATAPRIEMLAEIANEPARGAIGPDVLPLGLADAPARIRHGLGQGNNASSEICTGLFDMDNATCKSIVQTLPITFERLIRANEKEQKIHDSRSDQPQPKNKRLRAG